MFNVLEEIVVLIREKEKIVTNEWSIRKPSSSYLLASNRMCAHTPMNVLLCNEMRVHTPMNAFFVMKHCTYICGRPWIFVMLWVAPCLSWSHMTVSFFKQLVWFILVKAQYLVFITWHLKHNFHFAFILLHWKHYVIWDLLVWYSYICFFLSFIDFPIISKLPKDLLNPCFS